MNGFTGMGIANGDQTVKGLMMTWQSFFFTFISILWLISLNPMSNLFLSSVLFFPLDSFNHPFILHLKHTLGCQMSTTICLLVEPRMVGDAQVPLLRIVPVEGRDGEMITRVFDPIQYCPLFWILTWIVIKDIHIDFMVDFAEKHRWL
jgi:hypothetical protein